MTGKNRITNVLTGVSVDRPPIMPIIHTNLAKQAGMPLGLFFTDADAMADAIIAGYRRFGFDGVQLTLGVTGEAEALGARVEQPADGGPMLKQHLLSDLSKLAELRVDYSASGGRMPLYQAAVKKVVQQIGNEAFVLSTLRGPLNIASQLRGVENLLIDMLDNPEEVGRLLDFTTDVALKVSEASLASGAHALVYGEATCSPNFISPDLYRSLVLPRHMRLIAGVKTMGWRFAGLHVCGNIRPIFEDLIATGVGFLDVDYQVPATEAIALSRGRVALRGNLDPTSVFLQSSPEKIRQATTTLCREVTGAGWIMSSGCDIPPGASAENLLAFTTTIRSA